MTFMDRMKQNPSYYFWDNINDHLGNLQIYLGVISVHKSGDYANLAEQIINDLIIKCDVRRCHLKFLHDLDLNMRPVLHFLLIAEKDQVDALRKTLIYAMSKITEITEPNNYRDQINHYLGHLDLYQYRTIQNYVL